MRNGNNITDSCMDGNEINKNANGRPRQSLANLLFNGSGLIWIITIGAALLVSAGPAFGQFTVQPMKIEFEVTPGKLVKSVIHIRSFDPDEVHTIDLSIVELTQSEDGAPEIIEPNSGFDISKLRSCKDWMSVEPNSVELDPMVTAPVEVTLKVGRGIRGFYCAGILASIRPRTDLPGGDVAVIVRFLVPVVVEIQNRPMRPDVKTTDVGLEFIEPFGDNPARTLVSMSIENTGGTLSSLKPVARIWGRSGGHWRVITTTEFPDMRIIPGAELKLKAETLNPLPSGKYKIAGSLYVDGRRTKRIEKEIAFVGDTRITNVASDAPIDLNPSDIIIDGVPGATRSEVLEVINASEETVNVQVAWGLQPDLQFKTFGDIRLEDLNCTEWVQITPEQFTLSGEGGKQNLRIVASVPNPEAIYPCYYTLLALWATYPDGQKAGVITTNICVRNTEIEAEPKSVAMNLHLQNLGESKYLVNTKFGNYGLLHFKPKTCKASVVMSTGMPRSTIFLSGNPSLMLPYETRQFTGIMDLSFLPADTYALAAALEYAPGKLATKQMAIRVSIEADERIVDILGTQEDLSELIEVQW